MCVPATVASFQCDDAYISLWPACLVPSVVAAAVVVVAVAVVVDSPSKSGNLAANAVPSTLVFRLQFDP